jgi:hypothetical protein
LLSAFGDPARFGVALDARFVDLAEFGAGAFATGPRVACLGFACAVLDFALAFDVACGVFGFAGAGLTSGDACAVWAGAFEGEPGAAAATNGSPAPSVAADGSKVVTIALVTPSTASVTSANFEKRQRGRWGGDGAVERVSALRASVPVSVSRSATTSQSGSVGSRRGGSGGGIGATVLALGGNDGTVTAIPRGGGAGGTDGSAATGVPLTRAEGGGGAAGRIRVESLRRARALGGVGRGGLLRCDGALAGAEGRALVAEEGGM